MVWSHFKAPPQKPNASVSAAFGRPTQHVPYMYMYTLVLVVTEELKELEHLQHAPSLAH